MFELLPADDTGVAFINHLADENNVPYLYMGAGIAVGDYDNDGRVDLYLLSVDSPNRLYRQIGPWKFADVTRSAGNVDGGEAWSRGATFFDADNDGDLDLYVCNTEAPNLFYLNKGDGTFRECAAERGLDFVGASVVAAVADYDRDGDLDLYVVTHRPLHYTVSGPLLEQLRIPAGTRTPRHELAFRGDFRAVNGQQVPQERQQWFKNLNHWEIAGQRDVLYRNNGDGTFADVTESSGIGSDPGLGLSCTWMDFDGDGFLDLHVANDLQSKDRLYHNNRDGTFSESLTTSLPYTTWFSMGSDVGDINNDGRFDLLVVDMSPTTHYRAKLQMGDMNRFRYFMEHERPAQLMRNALFLNTGTSRFREIAFLAGLDSTDWTWAARLNDLDNDGWLDAFFTNGIARADEMNPDLRQERERTRDSQGVDALVRFVREQPQDATENLAFRNTGQLHFENVSKPWGVNQAGVSYAAAQVDLDSDGDLDLVVSNHNQPVSIYRNNEHQHHRLIVRLRGRESNRFGIGATVSLFTDKGIQTRQIFPVRGYLTCDESCAHFGLGDNSRIDKLIVEWPSGHRQQFEDPPADSALVVTEPVGVATVREPQSGAAPQFVERAAESGLAFQHREFAYDDFQVQPLLPGKLSQLGPGIAWGDANADGFDDLFVGGAAGQAGELFLNDGSGHFHSSPGPWQEDAECEDMAALWIDLDRDSDQDLIVASGSSEFDPGDRRLRDRVYINDGKGRFRRENDVLPNPPGSSSALAAADFDQDGDLDLFVGERLIPGDYPRSPSSYLLRNDGGRFVDVTDEVAPDLRRAGLVTSALWSDVDGDQRVDLLVAVEWGPIRLLLNQGHRLVEQTAEAGLEARLGWWNSLAAGDLDQDGDIDLLALNAGLNTKYRQPTGQKPATLLYGSMEEGALPQLIEVKSSAQGLLPVRGLSCSSSAMPFLRERFSTFHEFASAHLEDIYRPDRLHEAERFVANELASGTWINDGQGRFQWQPLLLLVQDSPGYGATITDLDGDGLVDLYFVQNLFSREPETGVWASGLSWMLRGIGQGRFELVEPSESGLVVPGDGKGMGLADTNRDGWPDLAAAQNNDRLMFFQNQPTAGRRSLAIRLQGPPGNPTGIGARLVIRNGQQTIQVAELYAGGGYLSQSSPVVFCGVPVNEDVEVEVRWPTGQTSRHTIRSDQSTVILEAAEVAAVPASDSGRAR
jgi:hypothetical protein